MLLKVFFMAFAVLTVLGLQEPAMPAEQVNEEAEQPMYFQVQICILHSELDPRILVQQGMFFSRAAFMSGLIVLLRHAASLIISKALSIGQIGKMSPFLHLHNCTYCELSIKQLRVLQQLQTCLRPSA